MMKFIKENWLLILSLIYVLSPIDFIPELILGPLGIVDDMAILLPLLARAIYKYWKNSKESKENMPSKHTQIIDVKE